MAMESLQGAFAFALDFAGHDDPLIDASRSGPLANEFGAGAI
jgi:hypothetical protein